MKTLNPKLPLLAVLLSSSLLAGCAEIPVTLENENTKDLYTSFDDEYNAPVYVGPVVKINCQAFWDNFTDKQLNGGYIADPAYCR